MTKPRHHHGRAAGSQVPGEASSSPDASAPADYAWIVNFNNGNADYNNRDNTAFVRAVRSVAPASECQGDVSLQQLHAAWRLARRNKVPSSNQVAFDTCWIDRLLELQAELRAGTWSPRPTTCFVAARPKAREIHAPDFADRVVHHWLVPQLEAVYEPGFIHDTYSNRLGKGTHAAVGCLRGFVRQVASGQGGGWYLQLDVHNFFNSIHRPTLWAMLKARCERAGVPAIALRAAHALLRHSPVRQGVVHRSTAAERALVPLHKRLDHAAPGCGLPIGNLSSQFLANVYLDALDQFVKRTLRAPRYLRYVDDFVLVHEDRAQLADWQAQIERFLADRLQLKLKAEQRLLPLASGIDFLGYVVHPTHTRVRARVVRHARAALHAWGREHVRGHQAIATPAQYRTVQSIWASYQGHFARANAWRLREQFTTRMPWLAPIAGVARRFHVSLEGKAIPISYRTSHL